MNEVVTKLIESRVTKGVAVGLGTSGVVLGIFQLGMVAGYHKAAFAYSGAESYYQTFGRHDRAGAVGRAVPVVPREGFDNSHGVVGKIISIDLPMLMVQDEERAEKAVLLKEDTTIRRLRDTLKSADIKLNDKIVVVGRGNKEGQIDARLVRVMSDSPKHASKSWMPHMPLMKH